MYTRSHSHAWKKLAATAATHTHKHILRNKETCGDSTQLTIHGYGLTSLYISYTQIQSSSFLGWLCVRSSLPFHVVCICTFIGLYMPVYGIHFEIFGFVFLFNLKMYISFSSSSSSIKSFRLLCSGCVQ